MSEFDRTQAALADFAAATARGGPAPRVRARLLKEVRRRRIRRTAPWGLTAAAALLAGVALGLWPEAGSRADGAASVPPNPAVASPQVARPLLDAAVASAPRPASATRHAASVSGSQAVRQVSKPSAMTTPWMVHRAVSPLQRGQILRLPVTAALARQFGVPRQSGEWQAEIFVGDDGLARAFRLVRVPAYE